MSGCGVICSIKDTKNIVFKWQLHFKTVYIDLITDMTGIIKAGIIK